MTPFITFTVIDFFFENCILLVYTIIGQVHKLILLATSSTLSTSCLFILAGSKTSQAFFEDVDAQRMDASDNGIYAQVELVAVQEKRVMDVLADDVVGSTTAVLLIDFLNPVRYEDSTTLCLGCRLEYPLFQRILSHILLQVLVFIRQNVSLREELEVFMAMNFS